MSYSEIKTPKAIFRLLHQQVGKNISGRDWPRKTDAVLVEMVQDPPVENLDQRVQAYIEEIEDNPSFEHLAKKAKKGKVRVCFGDLAESSCISNLRDRDLMILELVVGLLAVLSGLKLINRRSKETRRNPFFWGLVLLASGLWLLSSFLEILGVFLARAIGNTSKEGFLKAIRESMAHVSSIHPEKTVVFLRNLVIAEKAWELADLLAKKDHLPVIVLDFHFGHAGLLKMLNWGSGTRKALLHLHRPFIKDILKDPVRRDYLARLIVVRWQNEQWEVERNYLVDSLEDI